VHVFVELYGPSVALSQEGTTANLELWALYMALLA